MTSRLKRPLAELLSDIDPKAIISIYEVYKQLDFKKKHTNHVLLLQDKSYLCTCLLLQNSGIACRHFFKVMQYDRQCTYHIKLIPRRWYKEKFQDDPKLDLSFRPLIYSSKQQGINSTISRPPKSYLGILRYLFTRPSLMIDPDPSEISRVQRYGTIAGLTKKIAEEVEKNPGKFAEVVVALKNMTGEEKTGTGIKPKDPNFSSRKGRPPHGRTKSFTEVKSRTVTCGRCGQKGHNARSHKN
jgi:hypothetical protein